MRNVRIARPIVQASSVILLFSIAHIAAADHGGTWHIDPGLVVPSSSSNGSYTITWNSGGYYSLEEKYENGDYATVYSGTSGLKSFSGKFNGTYAYRIRYSYCYYTCQDLYSEPQTIVVTGGVEPPEPEQYSEQLSYEYQLHVGDFDGNGYVDLLVDRLTPGPVDGSVQTMIVSGSATGPIITIPDASALAVARTYPTDPNLTLGGSDKNFDGFADLIIEGLSSLGSSGYPYDCLIIYASGQTLDPVPIGHTFIDPEYVEFFGNISEATGNPNFYLENFNVTIRPRFGLTIDCPFQWYPLRTYSLYDCRLIITIVDYEQQVTGIGFHPDAPAATAALNRMTQNDFSQGNPFKQFSDLARDIAGVPFFGYRDDGSRNDTNYNGPSPDDVEERYDILQELWGAVLDAAEDVDVGVGIDPADYPTHEYDVGEPGVGTKICSSIEDTAWNFCGILQGSARVETIPKEICTLENVYCWQKRNPAPRQNGSETTIGPGEPSVLVGGNPIQTHVFDQDFVTVNETLVGHILHDPLQNIDCAEYSDWSIINQESPRCAYVHRETYENGDDVNIRTHGEGNNLPGVAQLNEILGETIFTQVDSWIRYKMAMVGACTDD